MKKRYINGVILKTEDYITSVNFKKSDGKQEFKEKVIFQRLHVGVNVLSRYFYQTWSNWIVETGQFDIEDIREINKNNDNNIETVLSKFNNNLKLGTYTLTNNIKLVIEYGDIIFKKSKNPFRIIRNLDTGIIDIVYDEDATIGDLPCRFFYTVKPNNTLFNSCGKIIPQPTITINGIEYILADNIYKTLSIYIIHYSPEFGIFKSRSGVYNDNIYIALVDRDIEDWTIKDYVNFINKTGLVYAHVLTEEIFSITNVYSAYFDNKIYEYEDKGVLGKEIEFYVNDVSVSAEFVRQMRDLYPEIQFYARNEDRDSTKYNEWVNYKIQLSGIKSSNWFTSHVWDATAYSKMWKNSLDIEFEYATNDLPTLLARRDQFRIGKFFDQNKYFPYVIDDGRGDEFNIYFTVFWDRDSLQKDYQTSTSNDDNGYSTFTMKYNGILGFTNLEKGYSANRPNVNLVESVIYTILYANHKADLDYYDDKINLEAVDLNFKSFLIEYLKLAENIWGKYGVDIFYIPNKIAIETFDYKSELNNLLNNIKSIEDSVTSYYELSNDTEEDIHKTYYTSEGVITDFIVGEVYEKKVKVSNYVMVASLKQVKELIEEYKEILSRNIPDFDFEDDINSDDEEIFTIVEGEMKMNEHVCEKPDTIIIDNTKTENKIENNDEDDDMKCNCYKESYITTGGEYVMPPIPTTIDNNTVNESGPIKQTVSGNITSIKVDDDTPENDDEYTLDIDITDQKNNIYGVVL